MHNSSYIYFWCRDEAIEMHQMNMTRWEWKRINLYGSTRFYSQPVWWINVFYIPSEWSHFAHFYSTNVIDRIDRRRLENWLLAAQPYSPFHRICAITEIRMFCPESLWLWSMHSNGTFCETQDRWSDGKKMDMFTDTVHILKYEKISKASAKSYWGSKSTSDRRSTMICLQNFSLRGLLWMPWPTSSNSSPIWNCSNVTDPFGLTPTMKQPISFRFRWPANAIPRLSLLRVTFWRTTLPKWP